MEVLSMERIIPISDLQTQAKKYVDQVKKTDEPVIITQRGRAAAVLMKYESYEGYLATQEEMTYSDWKTRLSRAQRETRRGKSIELEKYLKKRAP
jgi:prevent-host-death family protein